MKSLSRVRLFATPWTVAYQAPPFVGFFQARILEWVAISFSVLKEVNPKYSLKGLTLKLKLQYCGHLMQSTSLEKTLMLGKIEGRRRRG